mgnify:CR=1 FL=1
MENKEFTDYPFTANGVNFVSRIYSHSELAERVANIPTAVFEQIHQQMLERELGDVSKLSTAELLSELERLNEGGSHAFILLGAN